MNKPIRISLNYRIAIVFFILAGIAMTLTLSLSLSRSLDLNRHHLKINENVIVKQILDLCRIALFTAEYDDLQSFIEQFANDPHIVKVMMVSRDGKIMVSSDGLDIGKPMPQLVKSNEQYWHIEEIGGLSGTFTTLAVNFSHAQLIQANQEAFRLGTKTAIFGLIVITIVGLIIGHLLTRRLSTLSHAAIDIAQGNFDIRTNLSGSDEIAIVGTAFDHMAEGISEHISELRDSEVKLRQAHDELELRVTQRTAELAIARDDAVAANRIKSKFLARMSHELRTPLNAIIGYSELLIEETEEIGNNKQIGLISDLEKINSSGNHLLVLINDILDLAKIEAGKMSYFLEWFDIQPYLEDILKSLYPLSRKNNSEIGLECSEDIGALFADKVKVRQILYNLMSNAIKFTPGGNISILTTREIIDGNDWIIFAVQDNGVGISKHKLDDLFDEFSQLEPENTTVQIGTGLGLSLSQKFCLSMGGSIIVQSKKGQGSTFTMRIPAQVNAVKAA